MGKKASQAGQEWIPSEMMILRSSEEDKLEEFEPDERERFEILSSLSIMFSSISSNFRFNDESEMR